MADGDAVGDAGADLPRLPLREPLSDLVNTPASLQETVDALGRGQGPVAIDAERASGYRYSPRAYLVQLRREGSGTALIDPTEFDDLRPLDAAIGDTEWILHAATQDLPCLAELEMRPQRLFDTELAGRLLNLARVGLASLVQELLGYSLAKEHSAVDWSRRPLPGPWLEYAALDVEVLIELREVLGQRLEASGKLGWAQEEFDALRTFSGPGARLEPWRRVSGIHRARGRRSLAVIRELWLARNDIAAAADTSPSRVLHDSAIMEAAIDVSTTARPVRSLPGMRSRNARRNLDRWAQAVAVALALPEDQLPTVTPRYEGPPPARGWPDRDPEAAARLAASREALRAIAADHDLPAENLLAPDYVRRLAWEPPSPLTPDAVAAGLLRLGARRWQITLTVPALTSALTALPPANNLG